MDLREATEADLPLMLELAEKHYLASGWSDQFDAERLEHTFLVAVCSSEACAYMSERGLFVGFLQGTMFAARPYLHELCWYAEDGKGVALLRKAEAFAKSRGAGVRVSTLGQDLSALGYRKAEEVWTV